jgi:hypothetical protein
VSGIVYDSTADAPLAGAMVQLVQRDNPSRVRATIADDSGHFAIDSIDVGAWVLGFLHPRLDALGLASPLVPIEVAVRDDISTSLAVSAPRSIALRFCGDSGLLSTQGLFIGRVRTARGDTLRGDGLVRVQWTEISMVDSTFERRAPSVLVKTSRAGAFALCGIPTEGAFLARAFAGPDSSGTVDIEASPRGLVVRDLFIGESESIALPPNRTFSDTQRRARGNGQLVGLVLGKNARPIAGARVIIGGVGASEKSSMTGRFSLSSLPVGTYTAEVRALGYLPKRVPVDIPDRSAASTTIQLDEYVATLDPVAVRANRVIGESIVGFDERKKMGFGRFIDDDMMERRNPMYMSDALRQTPGLTIMPSGSGGLGGDQVMMRLGERLCIPDVFLNGIMLMMADGNMDAFVNVRDVRAIEVYPRAGLAPLQFRRPFSPCGSLVIWTGERRVNAK